MRKVSKPEMIREKLACSALERAKLALMNPELIRRKVEERTIDELAKPLIAESLREGVETVWDRYEQQQPACKYCSAGISCARCAMGPCRIISGVRARGVCGADADLVVSRNLLDTIATGAAAHSDHGREIVEVLWKTGCGEAEGYTVNDEEKLRRIAEEFGIATEKRETKEIARELGRAMLEEFGSVKSFLQFTHRAPGQTRAIWNELGILPRGIDREIVESMHMVQMGVGSDYVNILLQGLRTALSDGWGGSMIATEISDVLFGTPRVNESRVNLGVIRADQVNIALHGHNPMLSEMIVRASRDPDLLQMAQDVGAKGINLVGLCCTGNEVLMRKGIPNAGNHFNQELAIQTGALEAMIVDYQCIFPSLPRTAACYHTLIISTSSKAKMPGSLYFDFNVENALSTARAIVRMAVENFPNRMKDRVHIPGKTVRIVSGFSNETLKASLGGSFRPLVDLIAEGKIRGAVGIVGCNNPKVKHDYGHVTLARELIKRNILCVETGCAAIACGKAGLLVPEAADLAGEGLGEVCRSLKIPPVLHMGSCVDCSRILVLLAEIANTLGVGIDRLPVAGAAPEWYSQKAVSIGAYFVASGVFTVLGVMPKISGSPSVISLLTEGLNNAVGAAFAVEPDPLKAADLITEQIEQKRKALGI